MDEIKLVQVPVITHKMQEVGRNVAKRLEALNIDNLVATIDTVKSLKELRADLNKELKEFEDQRKFIKNGVMNPYNEFDTIYKVEISERYDSAIDKLKTKITDVEMKIKDEKKIEIINYLDELLSSEKIDFLNFAKLGLEINLTTTIKNYKEQCNAFVMKVVDDMNLIKSLDHQAEIMAEYKSTLNASKAIQDVRDRKERERLEQERIKQAELLNRQGLLRNLGMTFDQLTNSFIYNDEIYISNDVLKQSDKLVFEQKYVELEQKIKADQVVESPAVKVEKPAVISAPVVETKQEIVTASFEVQGTMVQMKKLKEFLISNNITYKNI
jgi:hypothetical protein